MADITKCMNPHACPKKKTCYRFTAKANPWRQSYACYFKMGKECKYYMKTEEKRRKK